MGKVHLKELIFTLFYSVFEFFISAGFVRGLARCFVLSGFRIMAMMLVPIWLMEIEL
jgi:hypothetical protein